MNFLTSRHIQRRTFLRGAGAAVALPFLDAMVPAGKRWLPVKELPRLVAIEQVHGVAGTTPWGSAQYLWYPEKVGKKFELSSSSALAPLEPHRDYLTIVSNTDCRMAEAYRPGEVGGDHFRSSAVFLTQAHPRQTEGSDVYVGTSLDQLYAQRFGQDSPIPSMQLCIENIDQSGGCAYGYTCTYTDSISWASPTRPLPVIRDPRVAFEMLFGQGSTAEERAARSRTDGSVLDLIWGSLEQLQRELGGQDRRRLEQYFDGVREVERRIQQVEARNMSGEAREIPEAPPGVPDSYSEHVQLMFDLQFLAFEADMTRVFSLKMGRDVSGRTYPEAGTDLPFHPGSHHGDSPEKILDFNKINTYHVKQLVPFLDKLRNTMDGDASLLDKSLIIYGSPMADGNRHNHRNVPFIVLGGANGQLEGGVHLQAPKGTPLANVQLDILHKLGLDDLTSFGDSTGELVL
jgi:hypothetical protein